MRRYGLLIAATLSAMACAQIAGFDDLSPRQPDAAGGGSSAGSSSAGSGDSSGDGGSEDRAGTSSDGMLGNAGTPPIGGTASAGGTVSEGGRPSSGGSAGLPSSAGNAGSGGSSPIVGACDVNLLRNSDFDAGAIEWQHEAHNVSLDLTDMIVEGSNAKLQQANVIPQSGSYVAWLGGVLNDDRGSWTDLMQRVRIPKSTSKLVVSGWMQVQTEEPMPAETSDHFEFSLNDDADGQWIVETWWIKPDEGTVPKAYGEWFPFSVSFRSEVLPLVSDRELTFKADAQADTTKLTSYWLDSLSLIATCPR